MHQKIGFLFVQSIFAKKRPAGCSQIIYGAFENFFLNLEII